MEFHSQKQQVPRLIATKRENPEFHLFGQGVLRHFDNSGVIQKVTNIANGNVLALKASVYIHFYCIQIKTLVEA